MEGELTKVVSSWCWLGQWQWKVALLLGALGQLLGAFPRPPPSLPTLVAVVPSSSEPIFL
jgi:hypothetical protein